MTKPTTVSKITISAAISHIQDGIALQEMNLPKDVRDRVERVLHVRERCRREQGLNPFALFKELAAGRYNNASEEWHAAKKDEALYDRLMENTI